MAEGTGSSNKFIWSVKGEDNELAATIDFGKGIIKLEPGFHFVGGEVEGVILGDRDSYRDVWCSLVADDEPDETLMVLRLYRPLGGEYGVVNDKGMPEQVPFVPAPPGVRH